MARKIERIDGGHFTQGIDVEQPVIEIAAEAVNENHGVIAAAALGVAQVA